MIHLLLALLATAGHRTPKLAVLDMVDLTGEQPRLVKQLTQVVVTEVAAHADVKVTSSEQISQILGFEKQKQLLGCQDDSCVTELAGELGVDYVMMEQLGKIGTRFRIDIRIANAQHANLIGSAGDFVNDDVDRLADAVVKLTEQVLVQSKLAKGLAPEPKPEVPAPTLTPTSTGTPMPSPTAAAAAPEVVTAASATPEVSHRAAYTAWAIAGALVVGAAVATVVDVTNYNKVAYPNDPNHYVADSAQLAWQAPLADGLWAAAVVAGGIGGYLYLTATPTAGAGGEIAVGGRF